MKKVLTIDDENDNLDLVSEMLKEHFQPLCATTGKEGIQVALREHPDAILLDVNMPEMDGFEVCRKLKDHPSTRNIPVIMLTAFSALDNRVKGLDLGADDFIAKPFQPRELLARINARVRRQETNEKAETPLSLGNLKLDPKSTQVWVDGSEVHLTRIELELLRYFMEHPNQVVDRTKLLGDLWPDSVVTNRTIDTHIANLRKKIKGFNFPLETIYGAGYILKTGD